MAKFRLKTKSCISLILVFCMIVGVLPMSAFAVFKDNSEEIVNKYDQNGDGYVDYISLGDSLTTGYGMDGYYDYWDNSLTVAENLSAAERSDIWVFREFKTHLAGYNKKVVGTYPYLLNNYFNGSDLTHWNQMGVSSMRTEEFAYMITGGVYNGRPYPMDELSSDTYTNTLLSERDTYIEKLSQAEVVSILLGDYSFSSAVNQRLGSLMGHTPSEPKYNNMTTEWLFDNFPEYAYLEEYYATLYAQIEEKLVDVVGDQFGGLLADTVDGMIYFVFSYLISNEITINAIRDLNPDVQIIMLGVSNYANGIRLENADGSVIDFSELFQVMVDFINAYRAIGHNNENCTFVDVPAYSVMVDDMGRKDDSMQGSTIMRLMVEFIGTFSIKSIMHSTVESSVNDMAMGDLNSLKSDLITALKNDLTEPKILQMWWSGVYNGTDDPYHSTGFDALTGTKAVVANAAWSIAFDKLESALGSDTLSNLEVPEINADNYATVLENLNGQSGVPTKNDFDAGVNQKITEYNDLVDGVQTTIVNYLVAVWEVMEDIADRPDAFTAASLNDALANSSDFMGYVKNAIMADLGYKFNPTNPEYADYQGLPGGAQMMAYLWLRISAGWGLMGHPAENGHEQIYNAVITSIENDYTGRDYVLDLAKHLFVLALEYGPEVLETVYNYAVTEGYIEDYAQLYYDVEAKLPEWKAELLAASDDAEKLYAVCGEIAAEIAAMLAEYGIDVTAGEFGAWLEKAVAIIGAYEDDILFNLAALIALRSGSADIVDLFWQYVDKYGDGEGLRATNDMLEAWHDAIIYSEDKISAAKDVLAQMQEYAVANGLLTQAQVDEFNAKISYYEAVASDMIDTLIGYIEEVCDLSEEVLANLEAFREMLRQAPEQIKAEFENMAFRTTYQKSGDDKYLVLGGAGTAGYGLVYGETPYWAIVNEEWEFEVDRKQINPQLSATSILEYFMENEEAIAEADIITYQLDPASLIVLSNADVDWSEYLTAEEQAKAEGLVADCISMITGEEEITTAGLLDDIQTSFGEIDFTEVENLVSNVKSELSEEDAAKVDELLGNLQDALNNADTSAVDEYLNSIKETIANTYATIEPFMDYIENLVYASVAYGVQTAQAMEYVQFTNPEAEFILVGMYNPFDGLKLEVENTEIDLDVIGEYVVEATNLYHMALALVYDKVIFVDVSDATILAESGTTISIDMEKLNVNDLSALFNQMYADADGHAYIAEQILGAVEFVEPALLGDVNCSGDVDFADAAMLYAYVQGLLKEGVLSEQGLINAEVSGDGIIDFADAAVLYAYVQGIVTVFPAETK